MRTFLCWVFVSFILVAPSLVAQTNATKQPPIPEEARKHFVMGETMLKEAKNTDDFSLAAGEFAEAARLAPQWPDARYNLALAKEGARDYSGAMADLKIYQQFKLTENETRSVQDKIYSLEAKQKMKESDKTANAQATEKAQAREPAPKPYALVCPVKGRSENYTGPIVFEINESDATVIIHYPGFTVPYPPDPPRDAGPYPAKFNQATITFLEKDRDGWMNSYKINRMTGIIDYDGTYPDFPQRHREIGQHICQVSSNQF